MKIRGLSLARPWPFAFTDGPIERRKRVENRSWMPSRGMMGHFIALHAAKSYDEADREFITRTLGVEAPSKSDSRHSEIFAICRVVAVVSSEKDPRLDSFGAESQRRWFFGPWGWLLADFCALNRPVACGGSQGLWTIPENVLTEVRRVYRDSLPEFGIAAPREPQLLDFPQSNIGGAF